jgi:flagellar biosynthesis/type III secretory pathway protein FliH
VSTSRPSGHNAVGAVRWSPDELEFEGVPFGGRPVAPASAPASPPDDTAQLLQQQALDEAFTQGFDAGRDAGASAERARLQSAFATVSGLLDELRAREARWTERMEENLCALASAVGRQLFDVELQAAPAHTAVLARRALTEFPIDQPVLIRVNPSDLASITAAAVADGGQLTAGRADTQWVPDPRIAPGGCVVEGRDRIIDGRVDTALERLYRRLTGTGA